MNPPRLILAESSTSVSRFGAVMASAWPFSLATGTSASDAAASGATSTLPEPLTATAAAVMAATSAPRRISGRLTVSHACLAVATKAAASELFCVTATRSTTSVSPTRTSV